LNCLILLFCSFVFSQYYDLNIVGTGQSHLIIFQETINISSGWEIGVFDQQAIINDGNCETEYGELLVAAGAWNGSQLELSAIGSIDFCNVGGEQRAGYIEDNEIFIRAYDPVAAIEYTASFLTFDGLQTSFISGFVTAISEVTVEDIYTYNSINQIVGKNSFSLNKIYPNPANPQLNIEYDLVDPSKINFSIYSTNGNLVNKLEILQTQIGMHTIKFDLNSNSSGLYFFKMETNEKKIVQKFMVLK
jgi:hypothetical protein